MTGIYKITNKINNKSYIGQSNNIERRKREYFDWNKTSIQYIDRIIRDLGKENFSFEVLEECPLEKLTEREKYYIKKYNSFYDGYNKTKGGQNEYHGNPKVTKEDVINIRNAYKNHEQRKNVYELYKDKLSFSGFCRIWDGSRWKNIMPEIYTEENKRFHRDAKGERHSGAKLSDKEVLEIRKRYEKETASQIWEDYKDLYTLGSFKHILTGVKYSHLPIYKKSKQKWINNNLN